MTARIRLVFGARLVLGYAVARRFCAALLRRFDRLPRVLNRPIRNNNQWIELGGDTGRRR